MNEKTVHTPAMISLVIPVYNEERNLPTLMERIRREGRIKPVSRPRSTTKAMKSTSCQAGR